MLKTLIKKPTGSQVMLGKDSDSSGRARLMMPKNANSIKSKFWKLAKSKNCVKTNDKLGDLNFFNPKKKEVFSKLK